MSSQNLIDLWKDSCRSSSYVVSMAWNLFWKFPFARTNQPLYIIEEKYQVFLQLQYYYVQVRYEFRYSELVISTSNFLCTSQCLLKHGKEELTTLSFEIGEGCQSRICACRSSNFAFISGDAPTYPTSLMPLLHITPSERYKISDTTLAWIQHSYCPLTWVQVQIKL